MNLNLEQCWSATNAVKDYHSENRYACHFLAIETLSQYKSEQIMGNNVSSGIHWEKSDNNAGRENNSGCFAKLREKYGRVGIHWNHDQPGQETGEPDSTSAGSGKLFQQEIVPNVEEMVRNAESCEIVLRRRFEELEEECRKKDELIQELEKKVEQENATIIDLENEQRWKKCLKSSENLPSRTNCAICNFKTDNKRTLKDHMEEAHQGHVEKRVRLEGIRCPICGLSFGDEGKVERHLDRCHKIQSLEGNSDSVRPKKEFSGIVKCNYCTFEIQVSCSVSESG